MDSYFQRQIQLPEIGNKGQQRLLDAKVLVVGAGGLGCPALMQLAACGVGHLSVVDFDVVELNNLHRQWLFSRSDLGKSKAEIAADLLNNQFAHVVAKSYNYELNGDLAIKLIHDADLVLDCTDNLSARYLIDDVCALLDKPWIHASVSKFNVQYALFLPGQGFSYRNLFPVPPNPLTVLGCNREGVLGVVPGLAGTLQANLALQHLLGFGGNGFKVHHLNTLSSEGYSIAVSSKPYSGPSDISQLLTYNYSAFCNNFEKP